MQLITHEEFLKADNKHEIEGFTNRFKDQYVRCNESKKALNDTLETNFRAVFRDTGSIKANPWESGDIEWDGERFFVVTESGRVLMFTNSEWGSVAPSSPEDF